jgi:hypothetical protein
MQVAKKLRMILEEMMDHFCRGRFADRVGHIDGEEIRAAKKAIDRIESDMVGIGMPGERPIGLPNRLLCGSSYTFRLRADEGVLAIGLVPNRNDFDTLVK